MSDDRNTLAPLNDLLARAANDDARPGQIIVPRDEALMSPAVVRRMAMVLVALGLSRRATVDWVAEQVFFFEGEFVWPDGLAFDPPEIDDVFGDASFKWVSDLRHFAAREPRQQVQRRIVPRLRLLFLAISVWRPEVACHLIR